MSEAFTYPGTCPDGDILMPTTSSLDSVDEEIYERTTSRSPKREREVYYHFTTVVLK